MNRSRFLNHELNIFTIPREVIHNTTPNDHTGQRIVTSLEVYTRVSVSMTRIIQGQKKGINLEPTRINEVFLKVIT